MNGRRAAKVYSSADELFAELDAEYEAENDEVLTLNEYL